MWQISNTVRNPPGDLGAGGTKYCQISVIAGRPEVTRVQQAGAWCPLSARFGGVRFPYFAHFCKNVDPFAARSVPGSGTDQQLSAVSFFFGLGLLAVAFGFEAGL